LAPEHPYPAAENDCRAAFAWLRRECPPGGGTARRAAIAGASAGGHLALAVAIDEVRAGRKVDRLFLAYPVVVPDLAPSHSRYLSAPVFDGRQAQLMWQRYLGRDGDAVVPLLLDDALAALPFTFVITVEHDPLRDGGLELVRRLIGAGVSVQSQHVAGAFHAYDRFAPTSELARQFRYNLAAFLERPAPRAIAGKIDS
jgi:acetyl esterase